jgi:hypothetical protein
MTTSSLVMIAATLALHPIAAQQQTAPPSAKVPIQAAAADTSKPITLTGCVVVTADREDMLQLVPAEPDPARPVGTSGVSPVWTVPSYLLLGGMVRFAEHANRLVEVTGVPEPPVEAPADPKKPAEPATTTAAPMARLQVQGAKVVAASCTPRQSGR